jgi:hypothetical protein
MATERANDLRAFRSFIDRELATGGADLGLDEALARWNTENEGPQDRPARTLQDDPAEWTSRLKAWVGSLPVRPTSMDDGREGIYAGRGE